LIDYEAARKIMIQRQLTARGIKDARVLKAMQEVPRHYFVEENLRDEAYDDTPLPIGEGQTISQPFMVAIMSELLMLKGQETVLEIGTGSGYQAAILSILCKQVYTVERIEKLSLNAKSIVERLGFDNIEFRVGDGTLGWPEKAPFDGIIVTAGAPNIPEVLTAQLKDGGRLLIPVGDRFTQTLKRSIKTGKEIVTESFTGCRFVDLIGEYGW
jgi:protein-L-isoaspartate(D-aspartate) O-methyltransferase